MIDSSLIEKIKRLPTDRKRQALANLKEQLAREERYRIEAEQRSVFFNQDAIRERCRTLVGFVREAWHVLEPNAAYSHNWHIDAICAHLEAVTDGKITRLLINVPPGSMKSLLVSVFWPAWEWGVRGLRSLRYLSTAFNEIPVKRDTRKTRDLIMSDWYQTLWPEVKLIRTAEMSFANSDTGTREGIPFGSLTSQRADRLLIDDPHSVETAESDADRKRTTRKFREGATNRLNNQERSAIIVIMQRLHEEDISGTIVSLGMDYVHLMLPMEFDPKRQCHTALGFTDPRTTDGELLDPKRVPATEIAKLQRDMGSYGWAGQYQQTPSVRGGAIFKSEWWRYFKLEHLPPPQRIIHSWDTAFKKGQSNDFSVRTIWAECELGYYLLDVWKQKVEFPELKKMVPSFRAEWAPAAVLVEDKASGQSLIQELKRESRLPILPVKVETDKVARAFAVTPVIESGRVFLLEDAPWLADYVASLSSFTGFSSAHDDDVDSTTQALIYMTKQGAIDVWMAAQALKRAARAAIAA